MNYLLWRKIKNLLFYSFMILSVTLVLFPLLLVIQYVFIKGASSLNWDFFTNLPKPAGELGGGMKHAILGTLYMVGVGGVLAIPLGVFCGVFLAEYSNSKLAHALKFAIDLLTGVPSIIIGIFAYILLVLPFKGFSAIAGGFALSIIILPIVTKSTEEILKLVPRHIREAGLALGIPRWKVIYFIIIKGNIGGIFTGVMLAISRAAGETAPLLFTAFGSRFISYDITQPMASLPVQIYTYAISPFDDWQRQAWAGCFVLIVLVLGINLSARGLMYKRKRTFKAIKANRKKAS